MEIIPNNPDEKKWPIYRTIYPVEWMLRSKKCRVCKPTALIKGLVLSAGSSFCFTKWEPQPDCLHRGWMIKNWWNLRQPCVADGWGVPVCVLWPQRENLLECGAELRTNDPGRRMMLAGDCLWVGDSDFWINGEARGGFWGGLREVRCCVLYPGWTILG